MTTKRSETVREMTQGQLKDISATLIGAIPTLTFEQAKQITGHKGKLIKGIGALFAGLISEQVADSAMTARTILVRLYEGEEVVIGPTDGTETIAEARRVFGGYIDANFKNWGTDKLSGPTKAQLVTVLEMREDASFSQMFGSLGDPHKLILTQAQITRFCVDHRDKLRQEGWGTFFLFDVEGEKGSELFVANVRVGGCRLRARVRRFDYSFVWGANCRRRVVVPQLVQPSGT